ncbi:MAG: PD40 domain-containing protein, partial [Verrucomicrobia bacterium]|nr:PD40 domain-containing protein [Verrucomicrobiota bacterium]
EEVGTRDRMAVFYTPQLLINDHRILMQVAKKGSGQIYSMNLDGSDAREFTRAGEGFPYGLSLSPDGQRVAFHLATGGGYQVWVSDLEGGNKRQVAARPGHIYFAPTWAPNGDWLAFQDCEPAKDPGHDWSDVCVCRPDGSEFRSVTQGAAMWFGATYGDAEHRGGGSNVVQWTREGRLLFPRRLPDSKVAWEYQPQRPDTDHFNRDFKPELARGGTHICRIDPRGGDWEALTPPAPGVWDFRSSPSGRGDQIVFCRAATGGRPSLWVMNESGGSPRELTRGIDGLGVDHPRWLPS